MNKIELDKAIDLSAYNDKGKKEIMKFFFCHPRIYQMIKNKGSKEQLIALRIKIESDRIDNTVWREGSQYFERILDYIEKELKKL